MNPIAAYRLASEAIATTNGRTEAQRHLIWCAKQVKFHIWSMLGTSIGCIALFAIFACNGAWADAMRWHESGIPWILIPAARWLTMFTIAFLLSVILLFSMEGTTHMRTIMSMHPSNRGKRLFRSY